MANSTSPTSIVLEIIYGPLDGMRCVKSEMLRLGRTEQAGPGVNNDLVLHLDNYSSRSHAQVSVENGRIVVRDLGSANGTWVSGHKLDRDESAEVVPGQIFVVGNTPLQLLANAADLPPIDPTAATNLSTAAQAMLTRGRAIAREQNQPWVGVLEVFKALARTETDELIEFFRRANLDPVELVRQIGAWDLWEGELAWIGKDVLRGRKGPTQPVKSSPPTPRVQQILTLADHLHQVASAGMIEPLHLLAAILEEGRGQPVLALQALMQDPGRLHKIARDLLQELYAPAPQVAPAEQTAHTIMREPVKHEQTRPRRQPVDHETWITARELMDRLQALQADYRLADPRTRFDALCAAIQDGMQKVPPAKRPSLVETLHYLFPVLEEAIAPPPPVAVVTEATPHSLKVIEDEDTGPKPRTMDGDGDGDDRRLDSGYLLEQIFGSERLAQTMSGDENHVLRLLQDLYSFSLDMERLAKGLVQTLQGGGGGGESRYFLPFTAFDLKMMIQKLVVENQAEMVPEVRRYLFDLGHWIIALIAAHQKVATMWSRELWERINPQAIRNEVKGSALNKVLGQSKNELWDQYERMARDLKPEITEDQLNERIGALAMEEFRRLSSRA